MMAKLIFDVTVSLVALVMLAPINLLVAVAVKLDSPGPVLYRQKRIGRHGRPFTLLKFRSMVDRADQLSANVSPAGDPRITRVGRFLRSWYLDELPQLINVVRGDMSLVGPRPETPEYVALYSAEERRILDQRPGLIGPSTLAFMDEAEMLAAVPDSETHYVATMLHERVRLDLTYAENRSLVGDIGLLVRQLVEIIRHHGR
jgi:lipopolysaccharide/colanic/teichoic acid biosynthesis glycosyltransferase